MKQNNITTESSFLEILMDEMGDVGSSKIPEPEIKVHKPVPGVGSVAFNETVSLLQMLISEPAFA